MRLDSKGKFQGWRAQTSEKRFILILGDLLMAFLALVLALFIWSLIDAWSLTFWRERVTSWYYFLPFAWMFLLLSLYDPHRVNNWRVTVRGILGAAIMGGVVYAVIYLLMRGTQARIGVGFFLAFAASLTLIWRLVYIRIFTLSVLLRRVLILGAGKSGKTILEAYQSLSPVPFQLVGFIDDDPHKVGIQINGYCVLAGSDHLSELLEKEAITDVVVAIGGAMQGSTFQAVLDAQENGVEIIPMPVLYEELLGRVPIHHLESEWLIRSFIIDARPRVIYGLVSRMLDILLSIIGLFILLVMTPFIALSIYLDTGGPILYTQERSGKGGRPHTVWKFRSMYQDAEKDGVHVTVEDDTRITRVGSLIRRIHLDEFPQFWNVLCGHMAVIGPRAERPELIALFEKQIPFYRARLMVKPGITGWAQVNYGYPVTIEQVAIKLEYDLYYIKHRSLLMDFSIFFRTIWHSLGFRGR
jgi:exopolysaccharide biosynthesis polyprenyl glycosylphosphotransferase